MFQALPPLKYVNIFTFIQLLTLYDYTCVLSPVSLLVNSINEETVFAKQSLFGYNLVEYVNKTHEMGYHSS